MARSCPNILYSMADDRAANAISAHASRLATVFRVMLQMELEKRGR